MRPWGIEPRLLRPHFFLELRAKKDEHALDGNFFFAFLCHVGNSPEELQFVMFILVLANFVTESLGQFLVLQLGPVVVFNSCIKHNQSLNGHVLLQPKKEGPHAWMRCQEEGSEGVMPPFCTVRSLGRHVDSILEVVPHSNQEECRHFRP